MKCLTANPWIYTFLLLLFSVILVNAQKENKEFEAFLQKSDSLHINAYKKRDTVAYKKIMNEFLVKYDRLDSADKKMFKYGLYDTYYDLCCLYSLIGNKKMALDYYKKSFDASFYDYEHILKDSDLNNIRNEEEFKEIALKMKGIGDYMYILKNAGKYNEADNRKFPPFTYMPADNPNLTELRKGFNLDSVEGGGNDENRIINLLHWVHNLIPHDGNHDNPSIKNAMAMIAVCKKEKRGLNCRGLATVLNECYLAEGFKSRIVTCLPKDSLHVDEDCHVINIVYAPSLKKWVWMDPTNDAYVMNEKGELLSIEEVRDRLVEEKPLILNPDANWNHKEAVVKDYYLYDYMAKNLYMVECPTNSQYNMETREDNKAINYVRLLPLEYYKQSPDIKTYKDGTTTINTYLTNNPSLFWQAP